MRQLSPSWKMFVGIAAGSWGLILLYIGIAGLIHAIYLVPASLAIATIITFSLYPLSKTRSPQTHPSAFDLLIMTVATIGYIYFMLHGEDYLDIMMGVWAPPTMADAVMGVTLTLILLEAGRRTTGLVLPCLVISFIIYILFISSLLPGMWYAPSWEWQRLFGELFRDTTRGYAGKLPFIIVYMVGIFVFLGPTMFATGLGRVFMGAARWVGGKISGGPAIVAVVSSALFGTLSGSSVANVATTGSFTIPLMKSVGFKPQFAAAVEATASTGGMIMPPIMASIAFLMPEFIPGITYFDVVKAAFIPAMMYFGLIGCSVYFHAKRQGIGRLSGDMAITGKEVLRDWSGMVTATAVLVVLLYLLYERWPIAVCGAWAMITGVTLHLVIGGPLNPVAIRDRFVAIVEGFVSGGKILAWLLLLLAILQVIIFVLESTGLGVIVSRAVLDIAGGGTNLLPALVVTMIAALVMGMGVAAVASYVIVVAVLAAPVSQLLGNPLVAHMFIFYFSIVAVITPPICAAVYAAAAIAQTKWLPVGGYAVLLGMVAFVGPYMFAYRPQLLMLGSPISIIVVALTSFVGIFFFSAGAWGQLSKSLTWLERILLGGGGLLLMWASTVANLAGLSVIILGLVMYYLRSRLLLKQRLEQSD